MVIIIYIVSLALFQPSVNGVSLSGHYPATRSQAGMPALCRGGEPWGRMVSGLAKIRDTAATGEGMEERRAAGISRELIIDILVLVMIWLFLLGHFRPELLVSPTTTSGGDTGSHNYLRQFMAESLAAGRVIGWSHDWYAGLPMFQFYFPMPYVLMALLGAVIHPNIAFKLVTALGTFMMPICAYASFRVLGFRFPAPALAAIFTLPFLFMQSNSMYGGNIMSTLAGEFSFSISMALSLVFMASLYVGVGTKRRMAYNIVLLALIALFHPIPIVAVALSSVFFLRKDTRSTFRYLLYVYLGGFLLAGFWSIPLLAKVGYSTAQAFTTFRRFRDVLPVDLLAILPLAAAGAVIAFRKRDQRILYMGLILLVSLVLFAVVPPGHIWNTRFLPWYYMMVAMIAAYGVCEILPRLNLPVWAPITLLLVAVVTLNLFSVTIDAWIRWNYSGFERKPQWHTFNALNQYLDSLPYGKVMHEFSSRHDRMFGTVRALELIPYFTNKPGMEGLLIESSASSPYFFYLQSEMSETPTCPISNAPCTAFDIDGAYDRMELFNVKYVVATSDKLKNALEHNTRFTPLRKIGALWVYEVNRQNAYVAPMQYRPVVASRKRWREVSKDWIRSRHTDVTVIYADLPYQKIQQVSEIQKVPMEPCTVSNERVSNEQITFETDCIGKPLLVKVTYSPNWQAAGGRVYLASPSFFVVIPEQSSVRLHYSKIWADRIGVLATLAVMAGLVNYRFGWIRWPGSP